MCGSNNWPSGERETETEAERERQHARWGWMEHIDGKLDVGDIMFTASNILLCAKLVFWINVNIFHTFLSLSLCSAVFK